MHNSCLPLPKKEGRDLTPLFTDEQGVWKGSVMGNRQEQKLGCSQKQGEDDIVFRS